MNPSSNASITPSRSSSDTRRLNVAWSALVISRSTIRSSGASSPTDSTSTLPTVEATTAPRSDTRGAPTGSPSRTARLSAAASSTSAFATETRTLTPERWLISADRRARWVSSAIEFLHERRARRPGSPRPPDEPMLLLADDRHLVLERARVVRPDLRAKAVLERGDDPAARGVVLRVGRRDHVQVQWQPHDEAADLDVALLEDVEQADLDPLGQVGQLVDRHDPAVGPRNQPVVEGQHVGQVAALGHLDRIDLADQVGDRDVRGRQLLGVSPVARAASDRGCVTLLAATIARAGRADRLERVVVELTSFDDRQPRVQQLDEHPGHPRLRLPSFPEKDEVVPGQDRVLDGRDDRILEPDDPWQQLAARPPCVPSRFARSSSLTVRDRQPAGAELAERTNASDWFGGTSATWSTGRSACGVAGAPSLRAPLPERQSAGR